MLNIPAVVEINNQNIHHCIFLGIGPFSLDENKLSRKNFGRKSVEPFFFVYFFAGRRKIVAPERSSGSNNSWTLKKNPGPVFFCCSVSLLCTFWSKISSSIIVLCEFSPKTYFDRLTWIFRWTGFFCVTNTSGKYVTTVVLNSWRKSI